VLVKARLLLQINLYRLNLSPQIKALRRGDHAGGKHAGSQLVSMLQYETVHFVEPAVSWSWILWGMFGEKDVTPTCVLLKAETLLLPGAAA